MLCMETFVTYKLIHNKDIKDQSFTDVFQSCLPDYTLQASTNFIHSYKLMHTNFVLLVHFRYTSNSSLASLLAC